ncbi:hypothetical protein [Streptomyces sp. NPDC093223]|jgi:hypothetical protein
MSDLKKEAASLHAAASGMRALGHHTAKPLHEFDLLDVLPAVAARAKKD